MTSGLEINVLHEDYKKDSNLLFKISSWSMEISSRRTTQPKEQSLSQHRELHTYSHISAKCKLILPTSSTTIDPHTEYDLLISASCEETWEVGQISGFKITLEIPESQIQLITTSRIDVNYLYLLADESTVATVYRADFMTHRDEEGDEFNFKN